MAVMTEKQLLALKEDINNTSAELSELIGQQKYHKKQLEEVWGCKSLQEATIQVEAMVQEREGIDSQIETLTAEIKEKYDVGNK